LPARLSSARLRPGARVTTAAHPPSSSGYVTINGSDYRVARVVLHPDYVRRPSRKTDIALIELADPATNHRYAELYRETDEVGQEVI
jgi:hypothetical protein